MKTTISRDDQRGLLSVTGTVPNLDGEAVVNLRRIDALSAQIPNKIVYSADHTGVPKSMGGRGIGTDLLSHLIDYARDNQLLILPVCSFVVHQASKHPDWGDVILQAE